MTPGTRQYQHVYQQRVVIEKIELDEKRAALSTFIDSGAFGALDQEEQILLLRQGAVMDSYSVILASRIQRF